MNLRAKAQWANSTQPPTQGTMGYLNCAVREINCLAVFNEFAFKICINSKSMITFGFQKNSLWEKDLVYLVETKCAAPLKDENYQN